MKKLVSGIIEFREKKIASYRDKFSRLAAGQSPDSLFIACSDSRVVPNTFASTDPGDLFVVRNVGNLIPCCNSEGHSTSDESEAAAIEFSVLILKVKDIIICGHSECGAMEALLNDRFKITHSNLRSWLRHGEQALQRLNREEKSLSLTNQLSQKNVLLQMENLLTYPVVRERVSKGELRIHGWWFELDTANVYHYNKNTQQFELIDEKLLKNVE